MIRDTTLFHSLRLCALPGANTPADIYAALRVARYSGLPVPTRPQRSI